MITSMRHPNPGGRPNSIGVSRLAAAESNAALRSAMARSNGSDSCGVGTGGVRIRCSIARLMSVTC